MSEELRGGSIYQAHTNPGSYVWPRFLRRSRGRCARNSELSLRSSPCSGNHGTRVGRKGRRKESRVRRAYWEMVGEFSHHKDMESRVNEKQVSKVGQEVALQFSAITSFGAPQ